MSKHILLAVCGGIAAYKSCELVRLLRKQGHTVSVAMSRAAEEFVGAQTFQALSSRPVLTETASRGGDGMAHISAVRAADVMLVAPATANTLAKIAHGIADNLITELAAARSCPLAVAPAMNVEMWHNPANLRNIKQLQQDGITVFMPAEGEQACGESGIGRLPEAAELADLLPDAWSAKPLAGKKVLLTAGAGFEAIDPVRGISNISSGRMGMALARACRRAGAQVSLVHSMLQTDIPPGLAHIEEALSAQQMYDAVFRQLSRGQDAFIAVAAVADYRVTEPLAQKMKKEGKNRPPVLKLAENPDILQTVAQLPNPPFCVGFAAESERLLEHARAKRQKKGIPLLVANDVALAMGKTTNRITLLDDHQETTLPETDKDRAAAAVVARMAELMLKHKAAAAAENTETAAKP